MDRSFIIGVISVFCVMVGCTLPRNGTVSDTNTNNDTGADAPSAGEGFEGSSDGTTGKGSPTNPPEDGLLDEPQTFELRTPIEITASSEGVPAAYSLEVSFDHAALVAAGKARADGDDVWVVRIHAGSFTVLPRVLSFGSDWGTATTTLWFRTLSTIAAASSDSSYFLYYGNSTVSGANDDPRDVFELFDDFDGAAVEAHRGDLHCGLLVFCGGVMGLLSR